MEITFFCSSRLANIVILLNESTIMRMVRPSIYSGYEAHLRRIENRDLFSRFVLDLNAATTRRHPGGRQGGASTRPAFNMDCTRVTIKMGP